MNKSENAGKRDKLISIRVNERLLNICLAHFKSDGQTLWVEKLNGTQSDLFEYLLLDYARKHQRKKPNPKQQEHTKKFFAGKYKKSTKRWYGQ